MTKHFAKSCKPLLATLLASLFLANTAWSNNDKFSKLKQNDEVLVDIKELHPTQFNVGKDEVDVKSKWFRGMSKKKFKAYLKSHPCPVVIGPGGVPYITDEQHRSNASYDAERTHHEVHRFAAHGQPRMYMKVIVNWSDKTPEEFEKAMIENHYTYLSDRGIDRRFSELPRRVYDMGNDSYRSVAGFLERTAWDLKEGVYFAQFQVATWLRPRLKMSDEEIREKLKSEKKSVEFLKEVRDLLQSDEAKKESWYSTSKCTTSKIKEALKID